MRKLRMYNSSSLDPFVLGRAQKGTKIFTKWEQGVPPKLIICETIRDKTLDELNVIFARLTNEYIELVE